MPDNSPPAIPELGLSDALLTMEDEKSELDKILEQFLDPRNIQHNSDLSQNEITAFTVLSSLAKKYAFMDMVEGFIQENLILRVSKGRGGRKEWVKITSRHVQQQDEYEQPGRGSRFGRFVGGRR